MSKPDEYKNIGDSFETSFEIISDKELIHQHRTTANEYKRQDISLEITRRLKQEIEEFNKTSTKQSNVMIRLTRWITGLTIALGVIAFIQLTLMFMSLS